MNTPASTEPLEPAALEGEDRGESLINAELAEEVERCLREGREPDAEAMAARYPGWADHVRDMVPILAVLHNLGDQTDGIPRRLGDYEIIRTVGKGGMGVVYEALQVSLDRRVALKVLPSVHHLDPRELQRFKNEARAAAHLHHTNIVPVYSVGQERGIHYFSMQFIDGRTLSEVLLDLQRTEGDGGARSEPKTQALNPSESEAQASVSATPSPSTRTPDPLTSCGSTRTTAYFRAVTRLGIQAAEALEHAHEKGVVHRDVKPSNLMVDADGKLWVTDFGLAFLEGGPSLTLTGDLVGTLRYMSPEQAGVVRGPVDARTDVYSLGATLYELFTLHPAFSGRTRQVVIRQIERDEPASLSRWNHAIPPDLQIIVLKAMSKEATSRYQSAAELADDLRRFLDNKPIAAKRPTLFELVGKWVRRHPAAVAATGAMLVFAVVALSLTTILIARERAKAVRQQGAAEASADEATDEAAKAEAVTRFLEEMLSTADPRKLGVQDVSVRTMLDEASKKVEDGALSAQPEAEARVRTTIGRTYLALGFYPEAEPHLREALAVRERLHGPRHEDVAASLDSLGEVLLAQGRIEQAELPLREALRMRRELLGSEHFDVASSLNNVASLLRGQGESGQAEALFRESLGIRRHLRPAEHQDVAEGANNLAIVLQDQGKTQEAEPLLREAVGIWRGMTHDDHPDLARGLNNLGMLEQELGRLGEAEAHFREAMTMWKRLLGPEHPDVAISLSNLAMLSREQGRLEEAEPLSREALAIYRKALGEEHPSVATTLHNLGSVLQDEGKLDEAESRIREAISLDRKLLGEDHPSLGLALNSLALLCREQQNFAEAERVFLESLAIIRKAYGNRHRDAALVLQNMAALFKDQNRFDEAESAYRECLAIHRVVFGDHPDTAETLHNLASFLQTLGRTIEAEPLWTECCETRINVLPKGDWRIDDTQSALGACLSELGRYDEAEPLLLEAHSTLKDHPQAPATRQRQAVERLAGLYERWNKPDRAAEYRALLPPSQTALSGADVIDH